MEPKDDSIKYAAGLFGKICKDVVVKCWISAIFIITHFFVDSVLAKAMFALFILILVDWATGMKAAQKTGDSIKSSKFFRTPIKIVIYFMLITCSRIAEYSLPDAVRYLDDTVIAFLTLTELISILENTGKLGYAIPQKLLAKLRNIRDEK